ncbi:hypothetical protein [Bartonella sp. HY761]|uniref:hypothetical protein n=1 Tax=Bartonella sp. HY761 TaxID=2979330 RepID=UPI0021FB51FE|nr:hypothetical protein [Bartonella sp. HY761]UXN07598.1 hypothetical protein N6A79_06345 [Bartonella sp. HY761]
MRLSIFLMICCGLDPKEAIFLPKSTINEGLISTSRAKTGEAVWITLPAQIAREISKTVKTETTMLYVNSKGKPWTV